MPTIFRPSSHARLLAAAACAVLLWAAPAIAQTQPATPAGASPAEALAMAGDESRGKDLVASSGCFDCHRIGDRGSRMGPDLSDIGSRRTPERLLQALVAPDEEVLAENRLVRFVTKDGVSVTGRLLNQDAISVQLINAKEELKSYLKSGLRDYALVVTGLMPSVKGKLSDQAVADIVAYLSALKAP